MKIFPPGPADEYISEVLATRCENADLRKLINYLDVCRIAEKCGGVVDDKTKNMIADLRRKLKC